MLVHVEAQAWAAIQLQAQVEIQAEVQAHAQAKAQALAQTLACIVLYSVNLVEWYGIVLNVVAKPNAFQYVAIRNQTNTIPCIPIQM